MSKDISIPTLKEYLAYDQETGAITWLKTCGPSNIGDVAGCQNDGRGYSAIRFMRVLHRAHRIAWALHYGEWPALDIDHINTIRSDNRISNLRLCTPSQNQWNKPIQRNNTSGSKGVSWDKRAGKWQANIRVKGKQINLGRFPDIESASAAYTAASQQAFGHFSRTTA